MDLQHEEFLSIKQYVRFKNVRAEYPQGESLECSYALSGYASREGDRIAIYKVGWSSVKQYVAFEWAPVNDFPENRVLFKSESLPRNASDLYQLCYISDHNETYGASVPFQFTEAKPSKLFESYKSSLGDSAYCAGELERDVSELRDENRIVRKKMAALTNVLVNVQALMQQQQAEIDRLREKVDKLTRKEKKREYGNSDDDDLELESLPPFPL